MGDLGAYQTYLDPEAVRPAAERLMSDANAAQDSVGSLVGDLRGLAGGRPWGDDEAGAAFDVVYRPAPSVLKAIEDLIPAIEEMGRTVVSAVDTTIDVDQTIAQLINAREPDDAPAFFLPPRQP